MTKALPVTALKHDRKRLAAAAFSLSAAALDLRFYPCRMVGWADLCEKLPLVEQFPAMRVVSQSIVTRRTSHGNLMDHYHRLCGRCDR